MVMQSFEEGSVGREERFEALYRSHRAKVTAYVRRRVAPDQAADIVADTFLVAWRQLDRLGEDPLPWLYRVAGNAISNARRANASRERLARSLAFGRPDTGASEEGPEAVLAAFGALSEPDREALRLVNWERLSTREAAAAMGCSEPAMKMRLHRARARLRRLITDGEAASACQAAPTPLAGGISLLHVLPLKEDVQ